MKTTFWIKKSGLVMGRIRVGDGGKFDISTETYTEGKIKNNRVLGKDSFEVNKKLIEFESYIADKYKSACTHGLGESTESFKNYVRNNNKVVSGEEFCFKNVVSSYKKMLEDGTVLNLSSKNRLSKNTIISEIQTLGIFEDVPNSIGNFDFAKYNSYTKKEVGHITVDQKFEDLYVNLKNFLEGKGYQDSSISLMLIKLKKVLLRHLRSYGIDVSELLRNTFKVNQSVQKPVIAISLEQTKYVINNYAKIREICTPAEKITLQYWVTALLLLARKTDMLNWTSDNIYYDDGRMMIRFTQQKTKGVINAPVPEQLVPIFQSNLEEFGRPLPHIPDHLTVTLKKIAKKLDVFQGDVEVSKRVGGKIITERKKEWEILRIHAMRATGITNLISLGVPTPVIKALSGHSKDSQSFSRYVDTSKGFTNQAVSAYENALS